MAASLNEVNLIKANLSGADLHGVDLTGANLSEANLTETNLTGAVLTKADLTSANLTKATLTATKLNGADLRHTCVHTFNLGKHFGYAWKNRENRLIIRIGCEEHVYTRWLESYKTIGLHYEYSEKEIKLYKAVIDALILNSEE